MNEAPSTYHVQEIPEQTHFDVDPRENDSSTPKPKLNFRVNKKYIMLVILIAFIVFLTGGFSYLVGKYFTLRKIASLEIPNTETVEKNKIVEYDPETASESATFVIVDPSKETEKAHISTPPEKTLFIESDPDLDGYRFSNGSGSALTDIRVGYDGKIVSRGFVGFNLVNLPPGSNVVKAILRLFVAKTKGEYENGGILYIDHLTYGNELGNDDYYSPALISNAKYFPKKLVEEDWYEIDVTNLVKNDVENGRIRSQYRLHFETENLDSEDGTNFIYFEANENSLGTKNTPQLVTTYN